MIRSEMFKFALILSLLVLVFIILGSSKKNILGNVDEDPVKPHQDSSDIYSIIHYDSAVTESWISLPYDGSMGLNPLVEFVFFENDSLEIAYIKGNISGDTLVLSDLDRYHCDCELTLDTLKANCESDSMLYNFLFFYEARQDTLYLRTASLDAEAFFSAYGLINDNPFLRFIP